VDEEYWAAYRRHVREGAARQVLLFVIGPLFIFGALLTIVAPIDYPPGDIRGEVVFRVATVALLMVFAIVTMVASARWLLRDRRK
jgi:hypothetical protein